MFYLRVYGEVIMGRLASENKHYKMRVNKTNGYKYTAILFQETNDKGKKYCKYKHYGTLDDDHDVPLHL